MDKRTILFILALSLTLFGVNIYFEGQNQEKLQTWNKQQIAKKNDKVKKLNEEIASRTVPLSSLPVVIIYADADSKVPVATGVLSNGAILALPWTDNIPQKVYFRSFSGKEDSKEAILATASSKNKDSPIIYQQDQKDKLLIGSLPEFGRYDLQLVVPSATNDENAIAHFLGDYTDGLFEIPAEKIAKLQQDVDIEKHVIKPDIKDALVLMKTDDNYVPVAIYQSKQKLLQPLKGISSLNDLIKIPKRK